MKRTADLDLQSIPLVPTHLRAPRTHSETGEHLRGDIAYLFTPPFKDPSIGEEKTRLRQDESRRMSQLEIHSSFPLPNESKVAKSTPPSSSRCEKDEKKPQEALRARVSNPLEIKICKTCKTTMGSHLHSGAYKTCKMMTTHVKSTLPNGETSNNKRGDSRSLRKSQHLLICAN